MKINFNLTGSERKALAGAISEILNQPIVYAGAPTFAYTVGGYVIDRNGVLSHPTAAETPAMEQLTNALQERGYQAKEAEDVVDCEESSMTQCEVLVSEQETQNHPSNEAIPTDNFTSPTLSNLSTAEDGDRDRLTVAMPLDGFNVEVLEKLRKIVVSKENLIKKALNVTDLPISMTEDELLFPWFTLTGIDGEADTYTRFIAALCDMAKKQKRVTAKEQEVENDKFAFRTFLIRLGLIRPEYQLARKILLRNLTGNSSWKSGRPPAQTEGNADSNINNSPSGENTEEV